MTAKCTGRGPYDYAMRIDHTLTESEMSEAVIEWLSNRGRIPANATCRVQWNVEWIERGGAVQEQVFKVDVMVARKDGCDT